MKQLRKHVVYTYTPQVQYMSLFLMVCNNNAEKSLWTIIDDDYAGRKDDQYCKYKNEQVYNNGDKHNWQRNDKSWDDWGPC